ncbi:L,D-transpeptidase family protein [Sphingopyxis kveilinensis]|uniref:L,D-transpeptidase family protein n=1 Tax=Sphingopyxis kveilinensis TaxID=3114367 RepID=UPI0030D3C3BC
MRASSFLAAPLVALACCSAPLPPPLPTGAKADRIVVVKHQGWLTAYSGGEELVTYFNIDLGGAAVGRKRFKGDGLVPEGEYIIIREKPDSRDGPSLKISYPNAADRAYAAERGRSAGGDIKIYGVPVPMPRYVWDKRTTDGDIGLRHAEMRQLHDITPDGTPVLILR